MVEVLTFVDEGSLIFGTYTEAGRVHMIRANMTANPLATFATDIQQLYGVLRLDQVAHAL